MRACAGARWRKPHAELLSNRLVRQFDPGNDEACSNTVTSLIVLIVFFVSCLSRKPTSETLPFAGSIPRAEACWLADACGRMSKRASERASERSCSQGGRLSVVLPVFVLFIPFLLITSLLCSADLNGILGDVFFSLLFFAALSSSQFVSSVVLPCQSGEGLE